MANNLREVSEIVGVAVKETANSRKRSGLGFGQAEEIVAAIEGMRENMDVLSGMLQEGLERLKLVQTEQKKSKLSALRVDISFLQPIFDHLSKALDPQYSGKVMPAEEVAGRMENEAWESMRVPAILALAPAVGLRVEGEDVHLGPSPVE